MAAYQLVVTSHTNPNLSGVARFNEILAERMGVSCVGFGEAFAELQAGMAVLLSVKIADLPESEMADARALIERAAELGTTVDLFYHSFGGSSLEYDMLEAAARVFCANPEIRHELAGFEKPLLDAWCPFLVDLERTVKEAAVNVFSFGMAHKMQIGYYRQLSQKLAEYGVDYSLWVSTAFHEKAQFGDFNAISRQLSQVFADRIQFLGFLSDDAINYFLERIQLFVAFFPKGVRANNTSIYVPMEKGLAVLTNLDAHSPPWMKHGVNVLDIRLTTKDDFAPARLTQIARQGQVDCRAHASWDSLMKIFARG